MKIADSLGLILLLMLLSASIAHAQEVAPEVPAAESRKPEPKKAEAPAEADTRSFTPSEEVSADAEVDFPADI